MTIPEFIYTVLLRPKPLRALADKVILWLTPARIHRHGATIVLNPADVVVSGALTFGFYERSETTFFLAACRSGMTILDVGANVGYYTALAIPRLGTGRIVAFEPDPENFHYLQQTVAANGTANVTCIEMAAAADNGSMTLYRSSTNRGDNRLYSNDLCDTSTEVAVATVDSALSELNVSSVNLIKIDVQGFEEHVLKGMENTLRQSPQLTVLMEFWPAGLTSSGSNPFEVLQRLENAGLQLFELTPKGKLVPLNDKQSIIERHPGRRYTNIVAYRGESAPPCLEHPR